MISVKCRRVNYATSSTHTYFNPPGSCLFFFHNVLLLLLLLSSLASRICECLLHQSQSICAVESPHIFSQFNQTQWFHLSNRISRHSQDHNTYVHKEWWHKMRNNVKTCGIIYARKNSTNRNVYPYSFKCLLFNILCTYLDIWFWLTWMCVCVCVYVLYVYVYMYPFMNGRLNP